ncbi:MAG: hypothetical protein N3G20_09255 [Verrucomicrobiae bacterium]|nr:hypothetical protein [Verrucomicrobiae bacterium]
MLRHHRLRAKTPEAWKIVNRYLEKREFAAAETAGAVAMAWMGVHCLALSWPTSLAGLRSARKEMGEGIGLVAPWQGRRCVGISVCCDPWPFGLAG